MRKMTFAAIIAMFSTSILAGTWSPANWINVKFVQCGRKIDTSPGYSIIQIGSTEGTILTYRSNGTYGDPETLKLIMSAALTAKTTGEPLYFSTVSGSAPSWEIDAVSVGKNFYP